LHSLYLIISLDDDFMKVRLLLFILPLFFISYSYGQSPEIKTIESALPHITDSLRYTDALNRLAMLLYEKNIDSTFYYTTQARAIAERMNYTKGKADAINNLGVVYDIKGNVQLSLRYYNQAYNIYTKLHDTVNRTQTLMNIAMVYQEIGKDTSAIANFREAMATSGQLAHDSIRSLVIYNYLLEYPDQFREDSVGFYIAKAKSIAEKYKDNRTLLAIEQLTADNQVKHGQRDAGLALLDNVITEAISKHMYYVSMDMLIDIGDQLSTTDSVKAVGYYKQGLDIAAKNDYLFYSEAITRKLYDFYETHHNNALAFNYCRQLLQIHDEQEKLNNATSVDYIDYALKEQQLESARINSRYETVFLIFTIVLCLMAVAIAIVIWRYWQGSQKTAVILKLQFERSEETTAALDSMNKEYARLIKIVAHDLRNPVGAVSSMASLMLDKDQLDPEVHEMAVLMKASADNSLTLISELLKTDFDHQQNIKKEKFALDEFLQQCIQLLSFRAKDKKQQLVLKSDTSLEINADHDKLWRVLNNLIVNAIKFSPEGAYIYIDAALYGNKLVISVKDNGIGIPPGMHSQLFDPFTSARRKGTGGEQPFGLGLYISKQIIEAHSGKIGFTSEAGAGTIFFIELPAEIAAPSHFAIV